MSLALAGNSWALTSRHVLARAIEAAASPGHTSARQHPPRSAPSEPPQDVGLFRLLGPPRLLAVDFCIVQSLLVFLLLGWRLRRAALRRRSPVCRRCRRLAAAAHVVGRRRRRLTPAAIGGAERSGAGEEACVLGACATAEAQRSNRTCCASPPFALTLRRPPGPRRVAGLGLASRSGGRRGGRPEEAPDRNGGTGGPQIAYEISLRELGRPSANRRSARSAAALAPRPNSCAGVMEPATLSQAQVQNELPTKMTAVQAAPCTLGCPMRKHDRRKPIANRQPCSLARCRRHNRQALHGHSRKHRIASRKVRENGSPRGGRRVVGEGGGRAAQNAAPD